MGSKVWLKTAEDFYILGLWLADGYWWSSSVGLSSTDLRLIKRFSNYLKRKLPNCNLKIRNYYPVEGQKRKSIAKHIYINNRELTRFFMAFKNVEKLLIPEKFIFAYLAGRIDGDGSIDFKYRSGIRIAYSSQKDANRDAILFRRNNVSIYHYKKAGTWVVYLKKKFRDRIKTQVQKYSIKLLPRRD